MLVREVRREVVRVAKRGKGKGKGKGGKVKQSAGGSKTVLTQAEMMGRKG